MSVVMTVAPSLPSVLREALQRASLPVHGGRLRGGGLGIRAAAAGPVLWGHLTPGAPDV